MDSAAQLANLKKKVMKQISEAAGTHDTKLVATYSALANRIEDDERVLAAVAERIGVYEKELANPTDFSPIRGTLETLPHHSNRSRSRSETFASGRDKGFAAREVFLDAGRTRGYQLIPQGKTVFVTPKRRRVAIPFANEKRAGRWFLGISDEHYDVVVLLCQEGDSSVYEFVLPKEFLEKFWREFSRSGGQVKFNVSRSGSNWSLVVPGHESPVINGFLGAYGPLRN